MKKRLNHSLEDIFFFHKKKEPACLFRKTGECPAETRSDRRNEKLDHRDVETDY